VVFQKIGKKKVPNQKILGVPIVLAAAPWEKKLAGKKVSSFPGRTVLLPWFFCCRIKLDHIVFLSWSGWLFVGQKLGFVGSRTQLNPIV
jgi:hypothetical protein